MAKRSRCAAAFAVVLMALALAAAGPSAGQDNIGRGRITGTVADEAGQPLVGARITVQIVGGTTKIEGVSDKKGRFAVAGMGTGRWRVTATLQGYVDAFVEMTVSQVRPNPPVGLTLKRTGGPAGFQADPESLAVIDRANALEAEGRVDEAVALFEGFLAKYPGVYQVRANLGGARLKKGDLDGAEADFKSVLDQSGGDAGAPAQDKATAARALNGLGEVALKRQDLEAAVGRFSEALALSPEDEGAAYNVGEILFSNQKTDEAIRYFELAVKIRKDWPKPYHKLGFVYLNKGDYAKALENFKTFVALDPGNPEVPNVKNVMEAIEKMKKDGRPS
jgi:predicted negative regulator of RcsB-dependent stress response